MYRLNIRGICVEIDFSFLIFIAVVFLLRDGGIILGFFAVSVLHEFGHGLALYTVGGKISVLSFWGMGIKMKPQRGRLLSVKDEAAVLLSGPLSNMLLYGAVQLTVGECVFGYMNLAAAIFNLLPYSMLDGGSLLDLLAGQSGHRGIAAIVTGFKVAVTAVFFLLSVLTEREFFVVFTAAVLYLLHDIWIDSK